LALIFALLTAIAALSPLLTLAWLWQVKEWRVDRLREHVLREGVWGQLFGRVRPVILFFYVTALLFLGITPAMRAAHATIGLLALLTLAQVGLRRQRRPVPTRKALLIFGTAFGVTCIGALVLAFVGQDILLPFIPFLQPLLLAGAWLLFLPLDVFLKQRIMRRARQLRDRVPKMTVVGVTGSVGKTTTKELLACVLQDLHPDVPLLPDGKGIFCGK
jgi:hypothetical protein